MNNKSPPHKHTLGPTLTSCYQLLALQLNEFITGFNNNPLKKKKRSDLLQDEKMCLAGGMLWWEWEGSLSGEL